MDAGNLFERPVFILAAPRSGSTLLFESLLQAPGLWTIGGESHTLIEGIPQLSPDSGMVASNRLDASHARSKFVRRLRSRFAERLRDRVGKRPDPALPAPLRMLEKTPKNALRQPYLEAVFPGSLYVWLYRDPRPNISSMMEAWQAQRHVTYSRLHGWDGPPWSLLLPPDWKSMQGQSLAAICAFQWEATNRIILDDLAAVPADRWIALDYDSLVADPTTSIQSLCTFAGLQFDDHLKDYLGAESRQSRYTLSAPDPDKWRQNEAEIMQVIDNVSATEARALSVLRQKGSES
jgi:hypothetical protein